MKTCSRSNALSTVARSASPNGAASIRPAAIVAADPPPPRPRFILTGLIATSLFVFGQSALGQFSPGPNPITGTEGAQTLTGGTGTINPGGIITTSGTTVGVTISGTATLNVDGTIQQTGTGRSIDNTVNNSILTVTNTGLITAVSSDAFRVNTANTAVTLTNSGTISVTAGGQAIDWAAITSASNSLTNQFGGTISSVGEDAVRPGTNGIVINAGTISATPTGTTTVTGSDGIQTSGSGVTVTNTGTISGRHGITGGAAVYSITINNNAGLITAVNGSGVNIDGIAATSIANVTNAFGATIRGAVTAASTNGDGDGVDVDGFLTLNNSGDILGYGAKGVGSDTLPNNADAVAMGGGTITNTATGQIIGSTLLADAANGDTTRAGNGILADNSSGGNAIAATSVTNDGLIHGKSGVGIRIVGTFADTITNNAGGIIRGVGTGAAIQTGDGGDTITNRGAIISDIGNAIDLEAGNDSLIIEGGAASISGNVSGGAGTNTLTVNPGTGNTFSYSGAISNFSTVSVSSGTAILSGASSYTGTTAVNGGTLNVTAGGSLAATSLVTVDSGGTFLLSSAANNVVNPTTPAPVTLNGGTLELADSVSANTQTFASLTLSANSTLDFGTGSNGVSTGNNLQFSSLTLGGFNLDVRGWSGTAYAPGDLIGDLNADATQDRLLFSGNPGFVNGSVISGISFYDDANMFIGNGMQVAFNGGGFGIVAVPEPASTAVIGSLALAGLITYRERRRIITLTRGWKRKKNHNSTKTN